MKNKLKIGEATQKGVTKVEREVPKSESKKREIHGGVEASSNKGLILD